MASPLQRVDLDERSFTYRMDFEDIERLAADPSNKLLILCNPHNPTGRVWSRDELEKLADICRRHGVRVISDEIHCELLMPGQTYVPYATVDHDAVVCNSPSKAFNTAGLQIANIVAPDDKVRAKIDRAINDNEVCDVNPFGVAGLIAAYRHGAPWLEALKTYLAGNYRLLTAYFSEHLPSYPVAALEATYLAWIDVSAAGISAEEIERLLCEKAHVRINGGEIYGDGRYIRINFATQRSRLDEALRRIAPLLDGLLG